MEDCGVTLKSFLRSSSNGCQARARDEVIVSHLIISEIGQRSGVEVPRWHSDHCQVSKLIDFGVATAFNDSRASDL
jgi:hypothetical protein